MHTCDNGGGWAGVLRLVAFLLRAGVHRSQVVVFPRLFARSKAELSYCPPKSVLPTGSTRRPALPRMRGWSHENEMALWLLLSLC